MNHSFSIGEAVRDGWRVLRARSLLIFQLVLTFFALEVVYAIVNKVLAGTLLGALADLALIVVGIFLGAGFLVIALKLMRGQEAHYSDVIPRVSLVVTYFLASLLSGIIVLLPILAFVVAAAVAGLAGALAAGVVMVLAGVVAALASVYLMLRYFFVKLAAVDGAGITGSLRHSAAMTAGHKWHLVLFILALLGINLLGLICLVVGLVVTIPLSTLAFTHAYLKLKSNA